MSVEAGEPKGRRRPTSADMPLLFEMIAESKSLRSACEELGLDAPSTVRFIDADERLGQQYAHARAVRGDGYGEKVAVVAQQVLEGKVQPDVGRVAMDGFKWTAARMTPKRWGDKVAHEHSGPDGAPIQHVDLSRLSDEQLEQMKGLLTVAGGAEAERPE